MVALEQLRAQRCRPRPLRLSSARDRGGARICLPPKMSSHFGVENLLTGHGNSAPANETLARRTARCYIFLLA